MYNFGLDRFRQAYQSLGWDLWFKQEGVEHSAYVKADEDLELLASPLASPLAKPGAPTNLSILTKPGAPTDLSILTKPGAPTDLSVINNIITKPGAPTNLSILTKPGAPTDLSVILRPGAPTKLSNITKPGAPMTLTFYTSRADYVGTTKASKYKGWLFDERTSAISGPFDHESITAISTKDNSAEMYCVTAVSYTHLRAHET